MAGIRKELSQGLINSRQKIMDIRSLTKCPLCDEILKLSYLFKLVKVQESWTQ